MYKINYDNVIKKKRFMWKLLLEAMFFLISAIIVCYFSINDKDGKILFLLIISSLVVLWNVFHVFYEIIKIKKRLKELKYLSIYGQLVKDLPFKMKKTKYHINFENNKKYLYAISVKYSLPNSDVVTLTGDARYDRIFKDKDGKVDLLIDPSNPKIYYLDFNIEKI